MGSSPVIGILGSNGTVSRALPPRGQSMEAVGWNTGNLVYQYAAHTYVRAPVVGFTLGPNTDLDIVRKSIDILHIPAANQLNPDIDLLAWAQMIEYIDKPLFIAGLGIQCELSEEEIQLTGGTISFIAALRKYAPKVGVRGASTARLLARYGLDEAVITGCPSNFLNPNVNGASLAGRIAAARASSRLRVDYFPGTISHHRDIESHLRNLVLDHDFRYILQTNELLFQFVDGIRDNPGVIDYIEWERGQLAPQSGRSDYEAIYANKTSYYFSAPAWLDGMAQRDLGIGMRMHGVIASIQGGTAGACVVSDGRIQELVNTMEYPRVSLDEARAATTLTDLIGSIHFDAGLFDEKRRHLAGAYRSIAQESGVPVRIGI